MADANVTTSVRFSYRKKPLPPESELIAEARRIYSYDAEHGGLIWKEHKNPLRPWPKLGTRVGGDDGHGYLMCLLLGHKFKVHQVVWMIVHGQVPRMSIDHANCVKTENRIENLRLATDQQNSMNSITAKRPLSGVKSSKVRDGFSAVVQFKGKKHYFGYFKTKEEAHAAYVDAKRALSGEFSPV